MLRNQQRKTDPRWWLTARRGALLGLLLAGLLSERTSAAPPQSEIRSKHTQDSLLARLRTPNLTDSVRVGVLHSLYWELRQNDLGAARRYSEEELNLARHAHYLRGELNALVDLSSLAISNQDYLRAEQLAQELVRRAATAPSALVRYQAQGLESIALVATQQNQPERAAQYYRQELAVILAHRDQIAYMLPMTYLGLSSTYYTRFQQRPPGTLPDSVVRLGQLYARQAQRLARRDHAELLEAASLQLQALIQRGINQPDSATQLMGGALRLYRANNATYNEASALLELAELALARKQPAEALDLAQQGRNLSRTIQDPSGVARAAQVQAHAYAALGQGMAAYQAELLAERLNDSITTAINADTLAKLQVRFDMQRKEGRIRALTQQQYLQQEKVKRQQQGLWGLGAVLLAVVAGLAIVWVLALRLRRGRTLLAEQNHQLERARASQDRLYAIVAHDLRGPLTAFQGLGPLLRYYHEQGEDDAVTEIAGEVSETADQCTRLLDNLLHYAANQAGELRYRPESVLAGALLTDIATLYTPAARAGRVTLRVTAPPDLTVRADRTMALTVLRNLTHNALKISPAGAALALAAAPTPDGHVLFTITDQGPGLPPERLAELLGQAEPTTSGPAGPERGTGLGLPLVRQLVRQQGGEFGLTSQVGVGTVARVTLPTGEGSLKNEDATAKPVKRRPVELAH